MIGDESGLMVGRAASSTARSSRMAGFLEYMSGVLAAFVHPAPVRAGDEDRVLAPIAENLSDLPGELHAPGETAGMALYGLSQREPGLINPSRAPRIYHAGGGRRIGFALIGGSLDARLSHTPAGLRGKRGGTQP